MSRPHGWSKWTDKDYGGQYTVLTVARLENRVEVPYPDEYVYGLKLDPATGVFDAFVMHMDDWELWMVPLSEKAADEDGLDDLI